MQLLALHATPRTPHGSRLAQGSMVRRDLPGMVIRLRPYMTPSLVDAAADALVHTEDLLLRRRHVPLRKQGDYLA